MKKQFDIKKLVLLNLPYLLMWLFTTNFGEAWRLAQGANASEKFLSLFAVLPGALQSFWDKSHTDFAVEALWVRCVAFHDIPTMADNCIAGITVPQRSSHIRSAEQVFAVFLNDTDTAKLRVFENFHLVHVVPPLA